jgi:TorA maturation chaperone TorD
LAEHQKSRLAAPAQMAGVAERGDLYGFLATLFRAPLNAASLRGIRSPSFLDALATAGVDLNHSFTRQAEEPLVATLAIDFTQLFHGPRGHIAPYESVQTGIDGGELNGSAAAKVAAFLEGAGLTVDREARQLPDHISIELEVMADLARREAKGWEADDGPAVRTCLHQQRDFLVSHLGRWGPEFCRKVQDKAQTAFYGQIASLLGDLLDSEADELDRRLNMTECFLLERGEVS